MDNKSELNELIKEKDRLERHLEWGKDILVFEELNWVRDMVKKINLKIEQIK